MTLILDSGGLSALAGNRARLEVLNRRGLWPPEVVVVVLAESLTGDHRRDFHTNRLLGMCRFQTGRAGTVTATDALVAAFATQFADARLLTSDPDDLRALAAVAPSKIVVEQV